MTMPGWQVYYFVESHYIQQSLGGSDSNGAHFFISLGVQELGCYTFPLFVSHQWHTHLKVGAALRQEVST